MTATAPTYDLRAGDRSASRFYRALARFADEVLAEAGALTVISDALGDWAEAEGREPRRSPVEYAVEGLALGVFWRVHGPASRRMSRVPGAVMEKLYRLRQASPALKPAVDVLRGVGTTLHLAVDGDAREERAPDLDELDGLVAWLSATGDFEHEAARLALWRDFLRAHPVAAAPVLEQAVRAAAWFEAASEAALGRWTANVDAFRSDRAPAHRFREDYVCVSRRRVEYHLNMVGAELLNRAYAPAFAATRKKAVLVPACLRARGAACPGTLSAGNLACTSCTPGCRIAALQTLGRRHGFAVVVVSHASEFDRWTENPALKDGVGMVGVACVLNLLGGGWKATKAGIPAQCVFLDAAGCRAHWHEKGVPTDLDFERLLGALGVREGLRPAA
jgi:hypothetical protein